MTQRSVIEARAREVDKEIHDHFQIILDSKHSNFRVNSSKNSKGLMNPSTISFLAETAADLHQKMSLLDRVRQKCRSKKFRKSTKGGPSYSVELKDNKFSNAVTFAFHLKDVDGGRKEDYGVNPSVKFFINGKFQVTGPKSATELVGILHHTCDILSRVLNFPFEVKDFSVNMINTDFYVYYPDDGGNYDPNQKKYDIDKRKLCNIFKSLRLHSNVPESHQSVEVNIRRSSGNGIVTIYVFPTSKIIITGGKCGADIKNAYKTVMDILDRKFGTFFVGRQVPSTIVHIEPEIPLDDVEMRDMNDMNDEDWDALPKLPPPTPLPHRDDTDLPPLSPTLSLRDREIPRDHEIPLRDREKEILQTAQNSTDLLDDDDLDDILDLLG